MDITINKLLDKVKSYNPEEVAIIKKLMIMLIIYIMVNTVKVVNLI